MNLTTKTRKAIGIGSTLNDLRMVYGEPKNVPYDVITDEIYSTAYFKRPLPKRSWDPDSLNWDDP